ncbi:MAG: GNAT family N-acetyltransferase [Planctomycetes bacterium]|nr:GNAT family N-acetyltransferase [Planctomycetota bacterium]
MLTNANPALTFRDEVRPTDGAAVRTIVESAGFFHPHEVEVAVELVQERLGKGRASGYLFLFAEVAGTVAGYTCFGEIPCTEGSYDLYWIAVDARLRGQGLGRELLRRSEETIAASGGRQVYIETSSRPLYDPTRAFYVRCGYHEAARLPDFYARGDAKVIYVRHLPPPAP